MLKDVRSGELHDRRPIRFDWRGAGGSESGEESGTSESRVSQGTRSVFASIAVEVVAPEAVSSNPSTICTAGSELRVEADSCAASGALSSSRAKSCPS